MSNEQEFLPFPKGFATTAIHHSQEADQWDSMAIVPPLVTSTTFKQYGPAKPKQYEYGRSGNPTRNILEQVLANLDNAKYGLTFASGLATHSTLLGLFNNGDHVICGDDVYGGTGRLFRQVATKFGLDVSFVDFTNLAVVKNSIKSNTKLIWVETPTNPLMKIVDIKAAANLGKDNNIIVVVDNTFLTPYLQRPIDLGADIVIYSLSKYMNGHSDVIMGALTTSNEELYEKLKFLQNAMGGIPSPFDCYLVNRGLKTLAIRMQQHQKNGLAVAKFLEQHPKVEKETNQWA
ncbi:cystathionine gamma-lyase isoform X2 [Cylas formicarius]|uniref:cystathionine gamma-lyase isoform X2 n=1 Tax=Cylas formicarius TaxID=197179 RepID=UPI0029584057|nr:cystathionine gamma-lyase isoform X2 [Cylas formicarius]